MAFGKRSIMDAGRSSSHYSTLTLVVFVALCLVGVWMMTSTTVVPVDMSLSENKFEMKQQATKTGSGLFEDSSRDVPDAAARRDVNINTKDSTTEKKSESLEDQNVLDKTAENMVDKTQEGNSGKDYEYKKDDKRTPTYRDENGNTEGRETINEGGETKEGGQENGRDKSMEGNYSQETTDSEQEKKAAQERYSDENGNAEGGEMIKEGSETKEGDQDNGRDKSVEGNSQETTDSKQEKEAVQEVYSDENGNTEGGEMIKEGSETKEGGQENSREKSMEGNSQETTDSEQEKKADQQTYGDENGNTEGREMIKDGGETKEGGQENGRDMSIEENSQETTDSEQEKKENQEFNETTDSGQNKSSEQNSDGTKEDEQADQKFSETSSNGQHKNSEQNPDGDEQADQKFIETTDNAPNLRSEQNSDETKGDERADQKSYSNKISGQAEKSAGDVLPAQIEEKREEKQDEEAEEKSNEITTGNKIKDRNSDEVFPDGAQSELLNETSTQNGAWSTQAAESKNEKEVRAASEEQSTGYNWKLCNVTAGADYIPCLDNEQAIKKLRSTKHYEHRERHCLDEAPTCLLPLPQGYKRSIEWPNSRNKIWYHNVPHTSLATIKGHQNWVKVSGEYLTFPGGGTQFKRGALHYIDFMQETVPDIAWGKNSRVVLDVGCGVASFGGYLFDRDVLTMSFAPKDEHEAQVQFALERGIPALSAVMGTKRLPFPGMVFDVIHCARCRVPWHIEGGMLLLELNRLLRPGGYFVWSATPVYQNRPEDVEIWEAMIELTKSMCWDMVNKTKDQINRVGMAVYRKPWNNECYAKRIKNSPPLCQGSDDPNAAWNIPLRACMHKLSVDPTVRGSQWPQQWPQRLENAPYWLNGSQVGVYGKPAPDDFKEDFEHWKHVVSNSYLKGMGIDWSVVRNVMDMRAVYGGFAAALQEVNAWVMNIVSIDSPDTLPVIYERGLFGLYHDWCESFSTYPRSYDLLHADHLFSKLKKRCKLLSVIAEVDRILRPEGKLIVRDKLETVEEVESMAKSLNWEVRMTYSKENEGLLCAQKTMWRPKEVEASVPSLS